MADLATLAIKVENGDVVKATSSLNTMTVAGDKTEKATQRLTRRMALLEIEARQMDAAMGKSSFTIAGLATKMGASEAAAAKLTTALGALSAIAALGFIGRKTIEETEAAQAAMAQLEAAVQSTGGAAGRSVAQLDALSLSLQKQTTFSDEAVKGAETMLLAFNKIKGAEFDRATAAVTDLAARMGGDLNDAALKVGKALQDPEHGLTQLRRAGIVFSDSQIAVVKSLYETGRAAEGMNLILDEMDKKFGGAAAAARDTLGGALDGLKNAWGDLFEVTKGASVGVVAAINGITHALESSGLSMNKILHDATVDWETMRASVEKFRAIMALQIDTKFLQNARNIIERIDFDLTAKIHDLNKRARPGKTDDGKAAADLNAQAAKDLAAQQKAMDDYYNALNQHQIDAIQANKNTEAQNDQLRAMIDAYGQGAAAVETLEIAQSGQNAVAKLGLGVSEEEIAKTRRNAEEHERLAIALGHTKDAEDEAAAAARRAADAAERDMERRAEELHRTISGTIEGILTDIDNKKNPFVAVFDNLKRGAIKAISDILATKIEGKVGDFLGIEMPSSKQEKAAKVMKEAADKQLRAAELMNGGPSNVAGITVGGGGQSSSAMAQYLQKFLKIGGAGVGGFEVGSAIGQTTGSKTLGVAGGALGGFQLGNSLLPGIGGAVGAIAGAIGGFIGAAGAAEEAARRLAAARKAFQTALDDFAATVSGDDLGRAIAQAQAQAEQVRQLQQQALTVGDLLDAKRRGEYFETLKRINELEEEYIAKLQREAAAKIQQAQDDLDVRTLRNQGKTLEADILQKQKEDAREYAAAEEAHMSDAYLAQLRWNQSVEESAVAAGKAADAINGLTTAVRGGPSGFKLNGYIQQFGAGLPHPAGPQSPLPWPTLPAPLSPPSSPTFSQSSANTGKVATAPVVLNNPVFQFPNITDGKVAAKAFLAELDKTVAATGGLNTTRAVALNKMTVS